MAMMQHRLQVTYPVNPVSGSVMSSSALTPGPENATVDHTTMV